MYGNKSNNVTGGRSELPRGLGRSAAILIFGLFMASVALLPTASFGLTLDLGTGSGQVGDTVLLPVELIDLGGDSVWSYELDLHWSTYYLELVGVSTVGTLSSSWLVNYQTTPGYATISAAGGTALPADGTLIWLEFLLGPYAGNPPVYFDAALLNEGYPEATLVNGSFSITAHPSLNISPDTGLIAVNELIEFSTTGGTAPYTYTSSDPAVADFAGSNVLTAQSPGFIKVTTEDAGALLDTTTGQIEVRAFRLMTLDASGTQESEVLVPIMIFDPTGYGIVSGEIEVSWYESRADFVGAETAGTLMESAGWGVPQVLASAGKVIVAGAGSNPLPNAGVLIYLRFTVHSSGPVFLEPGIFNEEHSAVPMDGYITVTPLPSLSLSPNTVNLMIEDTQLFTVIGSPTPPLTWSVDDPAVASIDAAGELTALADGIVQVRMEDSLGAVALSGVVSICTLGLPAISESISASEVVLVPITTDRWLTGLGITSFELEVSYDPNRVQFLTPVMAGAASDSWGVPVINDSGTKVSVYHAGATPLEFCGPAIVYLAFQGLPDLSYPYTGVSLTSALFNEGSPCVRINWGTACSGGSPAELPKPNFLSLDNHPNPFNPQTTIHFRVATSGPAELTVYSARGQLVRRLHSGFVAADVEHEVVWNGRDEAGRLQASGVYYGRLVSGGQSQLRKMVLLK